MARRMGMRKGGTKADLIPIVWEVGEHGVLLEYRIQEAGASSLERATPFVILCLILYDLNMKMFIRYHNAYLGRQRLTDTTQGLRSA